MNRNETKKIMHISRGIRTAAVLLALLFLVPVLPVKTDAAVAGTTLLSDGVMSAGGSWSGGGFSLTDELAAEGQYSFRRIISAGTQVRGAGSLLYQFNLTNPLDATSMTDVRFAFYVSDPSLLQNLTVQFELTSSGTCDVEESSVNTTYGELAGGKLKKGWNEMSCSLDKFGKGCDFTRFNFLRIYNNMDFTVGKEDFVVAVDWFRFTDGEDAVLPVATCEEYAAGWQGVTPVNVGGVSYVGGSLRGEVSVGQAVCSYSGLSDGNRSVSTEGKDYLTFRYYVSDAAAAATTVWGVELSSSGRCDRQESQVNLLLQEYTADKVLQNGWNNISVPLSAFSGATGTDGKMPDWSAVNFFRMYCIEEHNVGNGYTFAVAEVGFGDDGRARAALDAAEAERTEHKVPLWGCNVAWGNGEVDGDLASAGSGCVKFRMVANNINACTESLIGVVDATGMDTLEFDLYVSHAFILEDSFSGASFEITSSGTCDVEELHWGWDQIFKAVDGGVKVGEWNHVVLPLRTGGASGGNLNISHVNFLRNFWLSLNHQDADAFIALDNFVFTDADAAYQAQLKEQCTAVLNSYTNLNKISVPLNGTEYAALQKAIADADALYATLISDAKEIADESEERSFYYQAQKKLWLYEKFAALQADMAAAESLSLEKADSEATAHTLQNLRRSYERLSANEKAAVPAETLAALENAEAAYKEKYGSKTEPTPTPTAEPTDVPTVTPTEKTEKEWEPLDLSTRDYVFLILLAVTAVLSFLVYRFIFRRNRSC